MNVCWHQRLRYNFNDPGKWGNIKSFLIFCTRKGFARHVMSGWKLAPIHQKFWTKLWYWNRMMPPLQNRNHGCCVWWAAGFDFFPNFRPFEERDVLLTKLRDGNKMCWEILRPRNTSWKPFWTASKTDATLNTWLSRMITRIFINFENKLSSIRLDHRCRT